MNDRNAFVVLLAAALAVSAVGAGVVGGVQAGDATGDAGTGVPAAAAANAGEVDVSFADRTFYGGLSLDVDSVTLPPNEEGYVVLHDSTYEENRTGSVVGYAYVGPDESRIYSFEPVSSDWWTLDGLEPGQTTTWTVTVHRHSGDGEFDYVSSGGEEDRPYTRNGSPVSDTATITVGESAEITFDQERVGNGINTVTVDSVYLPAGGNVVVWGPEGFGISEELPAGRHTDVPVTVYEQLPDERMSTGTYTAFAYQEARASMGHGGPVGPQYWKDGTAVSDTTRIMVGQAPTVTVDSDVTVNPGEFVTVNSDSYDDGSNRLLQTRWEQVSGPEVDIVTTNDGILRFTAPSLPTESTLTFRVTTSDRDGNAASALVNVTVRADGSAEGGAPAPIVNGQSPTDPDGDGRYEDVDGDGEFAYDDVVAFFEHFGDAAVRDSAAEYDFDGDGGVTYNDVVALFGTV